MIATANNLDIDFYTETPEGAEWAAQSTKDLMAQRPVMSYATPTGKPMVLISQAQFLDAITDHSAACSDPNRCMDKLVLLASQGLLGSEAKALADEFLGGPQAIYNIAQGLIENVANDHWRRKLEHDQCVADCGF